MASEGPLWGWGKDTHGRGSGLTVTRAERPDGTEALWTSMLPLKCHGSPIVLLSRCSTVSERHRIREDGSFVWFCYCRIRSAARTIACIL